MKVGEKMEVINVLADGTVLKSMEGIVVPREVVEKIYNRLGW